MRLVCNLMKTIFSPTTATPIGTETQFIVHLGHMTVGPRLEPPRSVRTALGATASIAVAHARITAACCNPLRARVSIGVQF
jgi:hypothetical protein